MCHSRLPWPLEETVVTDGERVHFVSFVLENIGSALCAAGARARWDGTNAIGHKPRASSKRNVSSACRSLSRRTSGDGAGTHCACYRFLKHALAGVGNKLVHVQKLSINHLCRPLCLHVYMHSSRLYSYVLVCPRLSTSVYLFRLLCFSASYLFVLSLRWSE